MKKINIAIDGHSSCGKSTMAKALAQRLGYTYIDTGAMYRGVTLYSMRHQLWHGDTPDVEGVVKALKDITLNFKMVEGRPHLIMNGEDVEPEIRGMAVSDRVSPISTIAAVRSFLVDQQRQMALGKGVVMDGRDIGTVVLPDAELKVFVTASADVRARRRYDELQAKGDEISYEEVLANVVKRDHIDSTRAASPLRQADDALLLDNSNLSRDEQNECLYEMYSETIKRLG